MQLSKLVIKLDRPYLSDLAGVSNALEVVDSLVVVPELNHLVVTGGDKVLTLLEDGECVELT